ncbi:hypothetical protein ACTFIZ_002081 [Dictyostelium cf. discoideum]
MAFEPQLQPQNNVPIYGQPTLKQQQLYQQLNSLQQPQTLQQQQQQQQQKQQQQQPVIISSISGMVPMSKIKVRNNINCLGNYTTYKIDYPFDLNSVISAQEYTNYINDFNKIVSIKKYPIFTIVVAQLVSAFIIILFAIKNLFVPLIVSLSICLSLSFILIFLSIYLIKKTASGMKNKVKEVNQKLLNRNIYFEATPKYVTSSGKKFHVKLSIHYPTLGFIVPQPTPPQMYQTGFPIQQPSSILTTPIYQSQTDLQQQQYINTIDENHEQQSLLK